MEIVKEKTEKKTNSGCRLKIAPDRFLADTGLKVEPAAEQEDPYVYSKSEMNSYFEEGEKYARGRQIHSL